MIELLVLLVILALVVWAAKAVLAGLGAPAWLLQVVIALALIVGVLMVAQAFGVATPSLK